MGTYAQQGPGQSRITAFYDFKEISQKRRKLLSDLWLTVMNRRDRIFSPYEMLARLI